MSKYIYLAAIVLILGLSASTFFFYQKAKSTTEQNKVLNQSLTDFGKIYDSLSDSYEQLLSKKNYSISLSPTIETKISSVLGSSRQLTFQYYFTMDGNKIQLSPDSTVVLKK